MLDVRVRVVLGISLTINIILTVAVLWSSTGRAALHSLAESAQAPCWDLDQHGHDYYINVNKLSLPMHRPQASEHGIKKARLTNVVMPFHVRQEPAVLRNLELWKHFPPCPADGGASLKDTEEPFFAKNEHPGGPLGRNVTFTFFASSEVDPELELRLLAAFNALPESIRGCFTGANVRFSRLSDNDDKYLRGSRKMFEFMLNGWLGLQHASYVMYMEPDCLPIRPNWLMILDSLTRWPNQPFWIKGSIFRGQVPNVYRIIYNLLHINGNAIYNLGDPAFRHFYFDQVRPYIVKFYNEGAYDTDVFKYLLDLGNYNFARQTAHMFQFTDAIQNHWHSNYSISELKAMSEMVVMIHGGTPSP